MENIKDNRCNCNCFLVLARHLGKIIFAHDQRDSPQDNRNDCPNYGNDNRTAMKFKSTAHYNEVEENTDAISDDGRDTRIQCLVDCAHDEVSDDEQ